ncbi:GNAT family N-acetyltransferase [Trinickia fusca]|uniref:N-acetyltransferase n=1 Tax=Trinickia fusca TaxID=2419777 RepID=A0A494X969_9BURK|nr:GNAT family protein [Trinickia fusca]RKP44926.1 N-acetyltransferase [Trinickia fusca]
MNRWIEPVTLQGEHVVLEPLALEHEAGLEHAAADGELWKLWFTSVPAPGHARRYIETALQMRKQEGAMPFVVREAASNEIVGSTRYCGVDPANRRAEIGYTWYAKRVQRSAVNTEAKLLLLRHAFESLKTIAVELRTNFMNHRSRDAIARLGAKQDGILRNHRIGPDGVLRDSVVFSIIESEWPAVRANLLLKLGRPL